MADPHQTAAEQQGAHTAAASSEEDCAAASSEAALAVILTEKELNRQRKEKVVSEFSRKYRQTEQEKRRLEKIRAGLERVDQDLAHNINYLRSQIEAENRSLAAAQTEFVQAEARYLAAKKAVEKHRTKKLLLTQHLDTIILTNEKEKAHKLETLMAELGIARDEAEQQPGPAATSPRDPVTTNGERAEVAPPPPTLPPAAAVATTTTTTTAGAASAPSNGREEPATSQEPQLPAPPVSGSRPAVEASQRTAAATATESRAAAATQKASLSTAGPASSRPLVAAERPLAPGSGAGRAPQPTAPRVAAPAGRMPLAAAAAAAAGAQPRPAPAAAANGTASSGTRFAGFSSADIDSFNLN